MADRLNGISYHKLNVCLYSAAQEAEVARQLKEAEKQHRAQRLGLA